MSIWVIIFYEITIRKSYPIWPLKMAISVIENSLSYDRWFSMPPYGFSAFVLLYPPIVIEFINGRYVVFCTWVVIIRLVNTIFGVPTIPVFADGSPKLQFKLLPIKNLPNPWPKLIIDSTSTLFLTTFVLGATIVSTHVVVITILSDWITSIPIGCLWVSIIIDYDTLGEVVLTIIWWCSNMWLPIAILYGVEYGCVYTFGFLLLTWTNRCICRLCSLNGLRNSMPLSLFWTTCLGSYSYDWSNSGFHWCEYDYGTSSNTFTCAYAYSYDYR
jgi:hypothetical protein